MLLLLLFALIAGAGTAITPCVLPVVPALLSASSLGGRRRPIGIVVGLGADVHDRDRRARPARQGGRARERGRPLVGDHRPDRVRDRAADPRARRARAGAAVAPGPLRAQDARRRLLVGHPGRRRARVRVRAVRRADPGRGHVGQRLERRHRAGRRGRARLRGRAERGDAALRPRRPRRTRPGPPPHARPRGRAHARSGPAADRRADGVQRRRPVRGGPGQGHEPAVVPDRPDALARDLQRGLRTGSRRCDRRLGSPSASSRRRRSRRSPTRSASRSPGSRPHRCPSSAWPRTSPTLRTGSTRRGTSR